MRLNNRVALITGSSRGIGAAIAIRLAADGADVILHASRPSERIEQLASSINAGGGGRADIVTGDLSPQDAPVQVVRQAFAVHGSLDILVNNAGVSHQTMLVDLTPEAVNFELDLNLRATILATAEFARCTVSAAGRVINISSIGGQHPAFGRSVYSATKGAMNAFTRSAAIELGERGITVNAVAPGTTVTDLFEENERRDQRDWRGMFAGWTALRRVGFPEDIADIVAFVASDEARWLTAALIPADGGLVTTGTNIVSLANQPA